MSNKPDDGRKTMSDIRDAYVGNFFDAMFLPDLELIPLVICASSKANSEKDSGGKVIKLPILSFAGEKKRLILNKTNYCLLVGWFGGDEKKWFGRTVHIIKHYMPKCGAVCEENSVTTRIAAPKGTPIKASLSKFVGQSWPYGTEEPKDRPYTKCPIRPPSIADDVLKTLPMHEREAYLMAWIEFCKNSPDSLKKISAKVDAMLDDAAANRLRSLMPGSERSSTEATKKTAPKPEPPQAEKQNTDQDELAQWFDTIRFIDSVEQCDQFRNQLLPECPEPLRGRVEQELNNRETQLRKES